jgi:hypothetical protein
MLHSIPPINLTMASTVPAFQCSARIIPWVAWFGIMSIQLSINQSFLLSLPTVCDHHRCKGYCYDIFWHPMFQFHRDANVRHKEAALRVLVDLHLDP